MSKSRKKKSTNVPASKLRVLLWCFVALAALVIAVIALTEPRQLPALIADHAGVRTAYAWRDATVKYVHNAIYPLAALRDDADATPVSKGIGYQEKDRDALDKLLESKKDQQP